MNGGITGFDIDNQRIAKRQVEATERLAKANEELAIAIRDLTHLLKNETIKRRAREI